MRSTAEPTIAAPGRGSWLLDDVDYRLAETPAEKEAVYRLRYRAYLREGAIVPSSEKRLSDAYDDAPNAWTFGVYLHGELYSSIRVSVLTLQNLPADGFGPLNLALPSQTQRVVIGIGHEVVVNGHDCLALSWPSALGRKFESIS